MTLAKPWKKEDREEIVSYYRRQRKQGLNRIIKTIEDPVEPAILGTIVLLPILIVFLVVEYSLDWINSLPGIGLLDITGIYLVDELTKAVFLIVGSAILVTGTGRFVRTRIGLRSEKVVDRTFDKIPIIGSIYSITKVTVDTMFSGADELREPVKIKFNGFRLTAFKTGNTTHDGRKVLFLPTAPNITTGLVIEAEEDQLIAPTDEERREALSKILSAGFGSGFSRNGDLKRKTRKPKAKKAVKKESS